MTTVVVFLSPMKHSTTSRVRVNPGSFDQEVICKKMYPTLSAVLDRV